MLVVSAAAREIKESARKLLEKENSCVLLADLSVCFAETIFRMNISNIINCFLEMVSYDPSGVAAYSTVEENTAAKALHDYLQQLLSQCNATSSALQDHVCDSADMLLDAPPFQSANEILFQKLILVVVLIGGAKADFSSGVVGATTTFVFRTFL